MKKLLITAIAAAGMAFGLRADTLLSGSDFEDGAVPSAGWTLPQDDGRVLTNVCETYVYAGESFPNEFSESNHTKYLSVKTTFGKPISMNLVNAQPIANGAYLDTMVKFTACDPEDNPAENVAYAGAKIIVWLQTGSGADEDKTYLMIRANGADCATPRNFNCGEFTGVDAWHRLTIKSIDNIKRSTDTVPGFVVFVDEEVVQYEGTAMQIVGLDPVAAEWNEQKELFPSLVQGTGVAGKDTISAVAFDGQGCLDDLALTSAKPSFIVEPDPTLATVTINGASVPCKDAAAVNAALAGLAADQTATIQLAYGLDFTNVKGLNIPAVAATVTLDLNGQTITAKTAGVDETPYAITVGAGCSLTIIDSSTGKTGTVAGDVNADGSLTIEAGKFDGQVGLWGENLIKGGRYLVSANEDLVENATLEKGKMLARDQDDNAYYVVSDKPTYAFTMTSVGHATPQYKIGGAADWTTWTAGVQLYSGDTIEWQYVAATGYTLAGTTSGNATVSDQPVTVGNDITATATTYTITYTGVDGVTVTAPSDYTIETETITFTTGMFTKTGYEFVSAVPSSINKGSTGAQSVTVTMQPTQYTITYTYVDDKGATLTGVVNNNPATFTIESETITIDGTKITKDGYEFFSASPASIAQGTAANQPIAIVMKAVGGSWDPTADDSKTATDVPGIPEALAGVSLKQLSTWAVAKGVDFADASTIIPEAFLLNCANTAGAVANAKEAFKFESFDPLNPPTDDTFDSKGYNGTVTVTSYSDAACTTKASTGDQLFYRATLTPTPAPVKGE